MNPIRLRSLAAILLLGAMPAIAAEPYPGDSVYRLQVALTDQQGAAATLDRHAGQPTIVSMFYASCPHVCPMLVASVQRLERSLPEKERGRLRVLFVSVDSADDAKALAEVADRHGIDGKRWTLASASADDVRLVAATLGIRYRQLPDGQFSHSTVLTLLDAQGRIVRRTEAFTDPEPEFRAALAAALR
jgi:protein SCO1/2